MRNDLSSALTELQSVDRKAHKTATKSSFVTALEQAASDEEQFIWVQPSVYISDPNGEFTVDTVHHGLIGLTDRRVLFVGQGGSAQWPYHEMSGVTASKLGGVGDRAQITCRSGSIWFGLQFTATTGTLVGTLQQQIMNAETPGQPPGPTGSSTADELAKLAQLHAQGALNDDEFAAAKARILSP